MIATARAGKSFRALGAYLAERDASRVGWAETRNTLATDPRGAWAEMEADVADSGSRVEKPVYHIILSFDPADEPTEAELRWAVERTLGDLGLSEHQALAVRHTDTEHAHVHVMVNRVGADGRAWSTSNDAYRLRASVEAQERELGVRWTGTNAARLAAVERPPERAAEPSTARDRGFAAEVRSGALADLRAAKTWGDLDRQLAAHGLRVERRGPGAVVTDGAREAKLSSVSRTVSRSRLEARLGPLRAHERTGRDARPGVQSVSVARRRALSRGAEGASAGVRRVSARGSGARRRAGVPLGTLGRRALGPDEPDPLVREAQRVEGRALQAAALGAESFRALAARRAAAGPGRLAGLARLRGQRQVARVVSLVGRVLAAERHRAALGQASAFAGRVDSVVRLAQLAGEASQALEQHLAPVFADPAGARARVLQAAEVSGPAQAARDLAQTPGRFGRVVPQPGATQVRGWFQTGARRAAAPCGEVDLRVATLGPLVERAHGARTAAQQAIAGLGRDASGAELSRAAGRRTERLRHSAARVLARARGRTPSESLVAAVRPLSPAQRAQVAERVGQAGLAAVSRSLSAVKSLSQGIER